MHAGAVCCVGQSAIYAMTASTLCVLYVQQTAACSDIDHRQATTVHLQEDIQGM